MKIAAIITTCDRPRLLEEALASVLAQTTPPDEIIVVDDGLVPITVSDATVVRSGPKAGPSAARNLGVATATADVVLFLDDDDIWSPDHVARVAGRLESHDIVASAMIQQRRRGGTTVRTPPPRLDVVDWLTGNAGVQGSNLAIRRSVFRSMGGFDETLGCWEDVDLMVRAADAGVRYTGLRHPTVVWRRHGGARITDGHPSLRHAHRTFLAAHGSRMSSAEVARFRERCVSLFGTDPGPVPRLIWVLGPPGAGKTTWAHRRANGEDRVMDIEEAMVWLDGADRGVRRAKRHLADAVRVTEAQRRIGERRLFVTGAYFMPQDLGPLQDFEHLVCVVPDGERWERRLRGRDGQVDPRHREEHARWVATFGCGATAASGGRAW